MNGQGGYDLPDVDSVATAEEANVVLNRLWADVHADRDHPYMNPNHLQHQDFVDRFNELNRIKYQDVDPRPPLQQAMAAGLEEQEQERNQVIEEGHQILDKLAEFGYTLPDKEVPDELITPYTRDLLKLQLAANEEKWNEFIPAIRRELTRLHAPPGKLELLELMQNANFKPETRMELADELLGWVFDQKQPRPGGLNL